jgi:hypothetical protein
MPKSKNEKRPGKVILDSKVNVIWKCPTCGKEAFLPPSFPADSGVPICEGDECGGNDMEYVETRILK